MVVTLLNAVQSTGTGNSEQIGGIGPAAATGVVQVVITGTATVALEGSLDGTNWFEITSVSSSGGQAVTAPVYVRGNVTSYSSGDVTLMFQAPVNWVRV